MTEIDQIFNHLNGTFLNVFLKSSLNELTQIKNYLHADLENPNCKFTGCEMQFIGTSDYFIKNKFGGIKKYFTFLLLSAVESKSLRLLKEIETLTNKKREKIKSLYETDISNVEEFIIYAKQKIKTKELFYFLGSHKNYKCTKKEFGQNLYNFFSYKARINPNRLSPEFIEEMKGYYSLVGLGINDERLTKLANNYFITKSDPFSLNIPEKYREVQGEILMAMSIMSQCEKLLERIANDVNIKYAE